MTRWRRKSSGKNAASTLLDTDALGLDDLLPITLYLDRDTVTEGLADQAAVTTAGLQTVSVDPSAPPQRVLNIRGPGPTRQLRFSPTRSMGTLPSPRT